jgi:LysM repeat protein
MGFLDKIKEKVTDGEKDEAEPADAPAEAERAEKPQHDKAQHQKAQHQKAQHDKPAHKAEHHKAEHHEKPKHCTYTVVSGDTLSEIGARFGVPYMEIAKLNHIETPT